MRVLFATYSLAFQNPGGGERVMMQTAKALRNLGHDVDFYNPWKHDFANYDLVHYFSVLETGFWNALEDQRPALPFVVTPTFHGSAQFNLKNRVLGILESIQPAWSLSLASRSSFPDFWFPTTNDEKQSLVQTWGIDPELCAIIPNGVEERFLHSDSAPFRQWAKIDNPFVLHVGRFHPVKNQLRLIQAFKKTNIPLLLLGGPDLNHAEYYERCKNEALGHDSIRFLGSLPMNSDLLPSAYAAAKAFILPSEFETFGLAALEAAAAGVPLIYVTDNIGARQSLEGRVNFIDPNDLHKVVEEIETHFSSREIKKLTVPHLEIPGWEEIGKIVVQNYEKLIYSRS